MSARDEEIGRRIRIILSEIIVSDEDDRLSKVSEDLSLYGGGLEFDSLDAATLSALLEEEFGHDPFTAAVQQDGREFPQTVGDLVEFYENSDALR